MTVSFAAFLRGRADRSYRALLKEIDGVSQQDAERFSSSGWPDHRWGVGQNGSIAGIVYHVAAWKQMTLPVFSLAGSPLSRDQFDASAAPALSDWKALEVWITEVGDAWNRAMLAMPDLELESTRIWEGQTLPVWSFIVEMYEHDIQHASQIAYVKQLIAVDANRS